MKTRNFFLALFGFTLTGILLGVIIEFWIVINKIPPPLMAAPSPVPISIDGENKLDWLIPSQKIESACDNEWAIEATIQELDHSIKELKQIGLSNCYELAGVYGIQSHFWHQGLGRAFSPKPLLNSTKVNGEHITLFFNHDADFSALGLDSPKTVTLFGFVVHDLNGDGTKDSREPIIPGAEICLNRGDLDPICVISSNDGTYTFDNILPGQWHFVISGPKTGKLSRFNYTNQLVERDKYIEKKKIRDRTIIPRYLNLTKFDSIENEILIPINTSQEYNFYLMHEWATFFTTSQEAHLFKIEAYYDYDTRLGSTRIFDGASNPTYDQHDGLDASCPKGTEVLSAAEGRVIALFNNSTVAILHSNNQISIYGHGIPLVEINQYVPRGYPIALCDELLTNAGPHVHFAVWRDSPWLNRVIFGIPVYADLIMETERWIPVVKPLNEDHDVYILIGGRGVWTEVNQPHYPYVHIED